MQPPVVGDQNPGGIWFGTVFNDSVETSWEIFGITLDTGESRFIDDLGSQYSANITVRGDEFSGSLLAVAPVGSTFTDGSVSAIGSMRGKINERSNLLATYQISTGETGTLDLVYDSLYERSSSLAKVVGTWVDGDANTFTVESDGFRSDGSIFGQDSGGCVYRGRISIVDPSFNAYRVNLEVANCSDFDGSYNGLGFTYDWEWLNDNRLFFYHVSNETWSLTSTVRKL